MAEFKLGRLKFVWKDAWTTSTTYVQDDVVRYAGKTYVCTLGHTSAANFNTDLIAIPNRWQVMSEGQRWMGDWAVSTSYEVGDLVKYGGTVYVCDTAHTSAATAALGLEANQSDWQAFVESIDWKSDWAANTRFKVNDLVKYGGTNYICNTYHTSAATAALGLEADLSKWDVFSSGIDYKGTWTTATRYKLNDVVKFGSSLWICITYNTAGATFAADSAYWNQFSEGTEYESTWSNSASYQPGDVVTYGGNQYISKTLHTNSNPVTGTTDWDLYNEGLKFQSDWSVATSYKIGEVVKLNGYVYLASTDVASNTATVTATNSGTKYFTAGDTSAMAANMAIRFTGTTFGNVFTNGTYYVKQVVNGTTFTISTTVGGTAFTPVTASGTMTATFAVKPPNVAYWSLINSGLYWRDTWSDDTEYQVGDLVKYLGTVYICKLQHRSEGDDGSTVGATGGGQANSRPDQDITSTYWTPFAIGSETNVMTTLGDMVYYDYGGPTRLPVGIEGQVLRVGASGIPEWVSWGQVDHVYYVSPEGTDGTFPVNGGTLDRPWKTIRYAAEQVLKGPLNPNAQYLLELNRVFIQREVSEWIDYQVTNNISPFTTSFVYAQDRCERDTGWIVDAVIYDLGHGGNVRSRGAALAYVNALQDYNEVPAYTKLSAEKDEDIAAFNFMLTVVEDVLNNQAVTTSYQVQNGDNSTAIVPQYINTNYTAETGSFNTISSLVGIVTDALSDGNDTNIPERYSPNNTINIKTGQYRETLPIIVPEDTTMLGDELRSTHAGPAGSLISLDDAKYSIQTLGYLKTIVGQVVTGFDIAAVGDSTVEQDIQWPFATANETTLVERLVRAMQYKIDWRLNTLNLQSSALPTGFNTTYLAGYGDARTLILENKEFIKEEIAAYVDTNFPTVKYSRTACKRDVGYIVDAICYDLLYQGSTQCLNAGLAYFDGPGGALLIDSTESAATIAAYERLKTVLQSVIINGAVTASTGNTAVQWIDSNRSGGATANTFVGLNIDIIKNILTAGATTGRPNITVTTITGTNTLTTGSAHGLAAGDLVVPRTTANGVTADVRYYVIAAGLTSTDFRISTSYAGSAATITNGTGLSIVFDTEDRPTLTNAVTTTTALITAYTTLSAAVGTIVTNMTSYITTNYPTLVYNSSKCQRDARIILDAVGYDFMLDSNFQTMKAAYSYLRSSASDVFDGGQKAATRAAFSYVKTQAKANVGGDATAQSRIETLMTMLDDIIFGATTEGSTCSQGEANVDYAILQLERNRDFIVHELEAYNATTYTTTVTSCTAASDIFTCTDTSWMQRNAAIRFTGTTFGPVSAGTTYYIQNVVSSTTFKIATTRNAVTALDVATNGAGSMTVSLYYTADLCSRDIQTYIDAIKYDLKFTGNYRTMLAARYYANAVRGSLEEDFYYVRNGTGVRNQTLEGLTGDLLAPNAYGTSRVSAGAYVSLDPGYGPDDYHAWIITRSPYVQNVTTFGYAAIGQKIDGALHNGGNDSIVSNDFTQVISDGIGAWVTNNARAELVSVFTYYSHIGYLSENGGRTRATNGNNSYGDFGSVAEGFDANETPILAVVDNRQYDAVVGSVSGDGNDEIYEFEFDNAGSNYTTATWSIVGGDSNASVEQDEFRDGAVYNIRLLDNVDDSTNAPEASGNFGGFGYITNSNTAQGGTTSQITIAAVDSETSTAYVGMKIVITGGTAAGQYGIIATYNSGTKVATVNKESTGTSGWDHILAGTPIVAPDATSTYTIEPRITLTGPTYSSSARTLATSQAYTQVHWAATTAAYVSVTGTTSGSGSGATFTVVRKGTKYYSVDILSGGINYARFNTITIAGTSLGGASPANDLVLTITAINSTTGAVLNFESVGTGGGNRFVAMAPSSQTVDTSDNGTSWTARTTVLPSASAWTAMASGAITTIEVAGSFVTGRAYQIVSLGNTVWTSIGAPNQLVGTYFVATGAGSGTGTANPVANHLVAVSSSTTVNAYSTNGGVTWTAGGGLPAGMSGATVDVAYGIYSGNGRWVAIASNGATAYSVNGGVSWSTGGSLGAGTWASVSYGKGRWVAIASTYQTAYSTDGGTTWTAGGSLTAAASIAWSSVTYGKNKFVAVAAASTTVAAYSFNGTTWYASTLPSATWVSVSYGQGVFFAVSQSTTGATSEDGLNWTSRTLGASAAGYSMIAHGNPSQSGIWAAVQRSTAGTVAASALAGCTARARAYVAEEKIYYIRLVEPGSGYTVAPTLTITDPNNIYEAPTTVRIGNGALASPSFINRGTSYISADVTLDTGDGYADFFQSGSYVAVKQLTGVPQAGANIVFATQPNTVYKLVQVLSLIGSNNGAIQAFLQISPQMTVYSSPAHETDVTSRIRYSQVRLTGHDFLDIGTGNFAETNYPGTPTQSPLQANETVDNNGGRVFYTSTDQDGNFRVGELFTIEQSTGIATLNADAFNIAGLSELTLGSVTLGGTSATITEFSTDPFFTANSDSVVPTQRAIKSYIAAQIGGGGASLNVNSVVAGFVSISGQTITTTTGGTIQMRATFDFQNGIRGYPIAWNYFLT